MMWLLKMQKMQGAARLRVSTISDLGFDNGKVLVSGLSNKEFSSTFAVSLFLSLINRTRLHLKCIMAHMAVMKQLLLSELLQQEK
jgi:hypothetical protein